MNKKILEKKEDDQLMNSDHSLMDNPSTDESYLFKNPVAVDEKKFEKLKKKFGPTNKNFVGESNETKNAKRRNIGQPSHKQLMDKLDIVKM